MLKVDCSFCHEELMEPGGLLFDPPKLLTVGHDKNGPIQETLSLKRHICTGCMHKVEELFIQEREKVQCYLIINGQTLNSWRHEVSYEEIVKIAGMSGDPTMVCSQRGKDGFTMTPGMVVRTGREMIFSVAHTGNA